jgi:hypothetical protein
MDNDVTRRAANWIHALYGAANANGATATTPHSRRKAIRDASPPFVDRPRGVGEETRIRRCTPPTERRRKRPTQGFS